MAVTLVLSESASTVPDSSSVGFTVVVTNGNSTDVTVVGITPYIAGGAGMSADFGSVSPPGGSIIASESATFSFAGAFMASVTPSSFPVNVAVQLSDGTVVNASQNIVVNATPGSQWHSPQTGAYRFDDFKNTYMNAV